LIIFSKLIRSGGLDPAATVHFSREGDPEAARITKSQGGWFVRRNFYSTSTYFLGNLKTLPGRLGHTFQAAERRPDQTHHRQEISHPGSG
jgi:hypothetical protein